MPWRMALRAENLGRSIPDCRSRRRCRPGCALPPQRRERAPCAYAWSCSILSARLARRRLITETASLARSRRQPRRLQPKPLDVLTFPLAQQRRQSSRILVNFAHDLLQERADVLLSPRIPLIHLLVEPPESFNRLLHIADEIVYQRLIKSRQERRAVYHPTGMPEKVVWVSNSLQILDVLADDVTDVLGGL